MKILVTLFNKIDNLIWNSKPNILEFREEKKKGLNEQFKSFKA